MAKRLSMSIIIAILAIIALFLAAKNPTGPHTVSLEKPIEFLVSLGKLIFLLLPPIILSFFNHVAFRIISAVYQAIVVLAFLGLIIVGFVIPSTLIILIGVLGVILSIGSILITIFEGITKGNSVVN